jgi:glucan phosphoethanolaminetransferase (alkaline phosphatase superfamily)
MDQQIPPQEQTAALKPTPYGFGGWLYLFALGLLLTFFNAVVYLGSTLLPIVTNGLLSTLLADNPHYGGIVLVELVMYIYFAIFPLYLIFLAYRRKRLFRTMGLLFPLLNVILGIFYFFAMKTVPDLATDDLLTGQIKQISRSVFSACIWIPYMLVSKRVQNTFTM